MAKQDTLTQAREEYAEAMEAMAESHKRFREDLRFSNPANPEQWDEYAKTARKGRPMLTLDRTNQFIAQIVNDARQNKPSVQVLPVDSQADPEVAKRLNGIFRHIEYQSRAGIAYDTALELASRVGLGWLHVRPKIVRPETNEQELLIQRIHDPMAVVLDPNSVEPDGSDAMFGFMESTMTDKAFQAAFPKAKMQGFDSEGWFAREGIRVCERWKIEETTTNMLAVMHPENGLQMMGEDDYWKTNQQIGFVMPVDEARGFKAKKRSVSWIKMNGCDILEETTFPGVYVPLVPVLGYELWVEGKRYLCGMVRRMMDGQRLHNYEASAQTEAMMIQPKAPFLVPLRGIDGLEKEWQGLNSGNPGYLPYNDIDPDNPTAAPIAPPSRLSPPAFPANFGVGESRGSLEMQASVGMNRSSLGLQSNAVSGRAKLADRQEGDTANFHYIDNLRRSMEHMGRIIIGALPTIYDTARQAKILGEDGAQTQIQIDPEMKQAVGRDRAGKVVAINPSVGTYDVRVKIGPSYTTAREESQQKLVELAQGNPQLAAALAPIIVKMTDMPEAEKVANVAIALLPPNVQEVYASEEGDDNIPPAVLAKMQQMGQQMQEMDQKLQAYQAALDEAALDVERLELEKQGMQADKEIDQYKAETDRFAALQPTISPESIALVVQQTLSQVLGQQVPLEAPVEPPEAETMPEGQNDASQEFQGA